MNAQHINDLAAFYARTNLGSYYLKNRFIVAPMTRTSATAEGVPTLAMGDYYEAFARGGFGAVITEGLYTDTRASVCDPNQPGIVTAAQVAGWQAITGRVQQHETVFIAQLMHAGALSNVHLHPLAPSAVRPIGTFAMPTAMTLDDIKRAIDGYAHAAQQAVRAGFTGVELHGANGYLPDQFLTPYTNQRQDQYGGSVTNRLRFTADVLAAMRAAVPGHIIIGLRLSEGKVNNLAYRWEEGATMARLVFDEVARMAPDYVHVAAEGGGWVRECLYADGSSSTQIAKERLSCPVIANGGLHDLALAKQLLSNGHADLLAIGRYALANPDLPNRLYSGKPLVPFDKRMISPAITLENTRRFWREKEA